MKIFARGTRSRRTELKARLRRGRPPRLSERPSDRANGRTHEPGPRRWLHCECLTAGNHALNTAAGAALQVPDYRTQITPREPKSAAYEHAKLGNPAFRFSSFQTVWHSTPGTNQSSAPHFGQQTLTATLSSNGFNSAFACSLAGAAEPDTSPLPPHVWHWPVP